MAGPYGAGGLPGADDGLGAVDVRHEVADDPRVLHLERHVELSAAVPRPRHGAAALVPAHSVHAAAGERRRAEAPDAVHPLGARRAHGCRACA